MKETNPNGPRWPTEMLNNLDASLKLQMMTDAPDHAFVGPSVIEVATSAYLALAKELAEAKEELEYMTQKFERNSIAAGDYSLQLASAQARVAELEAKGDYYDTNKRMAQELTAAKAEIEQLRVQLAGCGVIAGCNTEESFAQQMPSKDAYGYSAMLEDVARCVQREMKANAKIDQMLLDWSKETMDNHARIEGLKASLKEQKLVAPLDKILPEIHERLKTYSTNSHMGSRSEGVLIKFEKFLKAYRGEDVE